MVLLLTMETAGRVAIGKKGTDEFSWGIMNLRSLFDSQASKHNKRMVVDIK